MLNLNKEMLAELLAINNQEILRFFIVPNFKARFRQS